MGKSRFAAELAGHLGIDSAWFEVGSGVSSAAVLEWARRHPDGLLVVDRAEEGVDAVAATVNEVTGSTPGVRILVTSRVPVAAVESPVEVLGPLPTPTPDADDEVIEASPSVVALRAALGELAPAVSPSPAEAAALARRAGGLPLAAWTVAMRAHLHAEDIGAAIACGRRAAAGLARVPPGETVRFGTELAAAAIAARDEVAAARILGVIAVTPDRRELPFPSPAEGTRREALLRTLDDRLGDETARHVEAGRRCSLAEAAGSLLA